MSSTAAVSPRSTSRAGMRMRSQHTNTKLGDVAAQLVADVVQSDRGSDIA